ncbi:CPBP family intramembrane glutamic endopeptidase [Natrialba sp. SSL1]|uniref:CPBP family intramembrane glutamic endopeptidase n=1 Tax=Natrialba sp. SSL1 TaxID=1869245 RepID=UPI0008F84245|nr:type II CAAX endopeptidase family protein [Natrialba sp. SSL1]OIB57453.1 abortive phage infection protein [Natrialba sp. SSL1]
MTETARTESGSVATDAVPGIGTGLSAVMAATVLVPANQGITDPAVIAAAVFAVVAVGAFLAIRYGSGTHRIAAGIATAASGGVLLCTAYALNQGLTASTELPGLSTSISLLMAGFLIAGLTVGIGVAAALEISAAGLRDRSSQMIVLTLLGVTGLFAAELAGVFLALPVMEIVGDLSTPGFLVIAQLGMALGTAIIAGIYLSVTDRGLEFLDLRVPTKWDVIWTVGGLAFLFGVLMTISLAFQTIGVESADHGTTEQAAENPEILLVLIPASLLVIGPFEELLYRNVIQKALYDTFSRVGAIVAGSVIFAGVHVLAYATAGPGAVIASLGVIFGLSLVLGTLYERTDNLLVPSVVHGVYNAILFANLYLVYG